MSVGADLSFDWQGLSCFGSRRLLGSKRVVLLNSSQGKQPTGRDLWVRGTLRAIEKYASEDCVLLTSVGLNTWELACWAAGVRRIPQVVAVPDDGTRTHEDIYREVSEDFSLEDGTFCLVFLPSKPGKPKSFWEPRDRKLVELGEVAVPIGVKRGGRLDSILGDHGPSKQVNDDFRVEWSPPRASVRPVPLRKEDVRRELDTRFEGFLTHWTRSSDGPWPGETRAGYYKAVVESDGEYPRSAGKTLERILREERIRASSWRIRGGQSVVSFTSLLPSEAVDLMRWRKRYARYTVEPCGIAVQEEVAKAAGVCPVQYVSAKNPVPGVPEYLLQGRSTRAEWPLEKEYRHLGDFDLSRQPNGSWEAIDLPSLLGIGRSWT
jgi:hypothetical protein